MIEGLVSIIMPSYNAARFIGESINSVFLQTYSNWELLIVDDCSKDNSVRIVRKFVDIDRRVRIFPLEKNVGAAAARNIAIGQAKGQYIAFLDSDDVWNEDKLERQLAFMKKNSYAFTFSDYYVMEEDGKRLILDWDHRANNIQLTDNLVGRTTIIASIRIREVILNKRHVHPNSQFLRQLHIQIRTSVKLFTI